MNNLKNRLITGATAENFSEYFALVLQKVWDENK
jgi:hypothetical protein